MKRGLVLPDYEYADVTKIDASLFRGKKLIIFDVDNTLVLTETTQVPKQIHAWLKGVRKKYQCICVSNSRTISFRAKKLEKLLGCKIIVSKYRKPSKRLFAEVVKYYPIKPEKIVLIGDRLFTDVLFGNRLGMVTILVHRLTTREKVSTKIMRIIEWIVKKVLEAGRETLI